MTNDVRYPDIEVELLGQDGNAFMILGKVSKELKRALIDVPYRMTPAEAKEEADRYLAEATLGDYDELLATTMKWVSVT